MSYENCKSRKIRKHALNGAHHAGPPAGRRGGFEMNAAPERSLGAVAMAIVANMLRFGRGNK